MKKLSLAFIALAVLGYESLAYAQPAAGPAAAPRRYGAAGCGLGSMVFGPSPGIVQVLAATTNGTLGSQTFGITSGTSNCADTVTVVVATASFVEANREVLAKDIARGSGETISTLSSLAGCSNAKDVGVTLQSRFSEIFSSPAVTDVEVSGKVISILRSEKSLSCEKLRAETHKRVAGK